MTGPATEDTYRDRLRVRLIQVVEQVIANEGLSAVQARRVAQEAECSVGTLYNIFGDIDGLILSANERTLHDLGRALTAAARRTAAADLLTRLMALATAYLDFATLNQCRWRTVFEHRLPDAKPVPEAYVEDRRRLLAMIEMQLESTIADLNCRSDAAHALFSAVHGIVLLSLDAKLGPFEPAQCERQIRFIVAHVVKGLVPASGT
jgi:AcrR family transcriptional regulator